MNDSVYPDWRLVASIVLSIVLIIGTYILVNGVGSPRVASAGDETEILRAISMKDTDKDGLPDWEESLYGTDLNKADTFNLGMSDSEAVSRGLIVPKAIADAPVREDGSQMIVDPDLPPAPADGTLTAEFAKTFMTLFIQKKNEKNGGDLTDQDVNDIVSQSLSALSSSIKPTPDFKKESDLIISGSGPEAMKLFAGQVEDVFNEGYIMATTSEIVYFKSALVDHNTNAYIQMLAIAKGYREMSAGLSALKVPKELVQADLLLINSLMHLSQVITDLTLADSDTLTAILALRQYPNHLVNLAKAFTDIGNIYSNNGIVLSKGDKGAQFVNMMRDINADKAKI